MIEHLVYGIIIGAVVVASLAIAVCISAAAAALINDAFRRW
jgi:outer membrane murein-binding lipoprotein Lpp